MKKVKRDFFSLFWKLTLICLWPRASGVTVYLLLILQYGVLCIYAVMALLLLSYEACCNVLWAWQAEKSRRHDTQRSQNKLLAPCLWLLGPWNQVWMLLMSLHHSCGISNILYSIYIIYVVNRASTFPTGILYNIRDGKMLAGLTLAEHSDGDWRDMLA